MKHHIVPLTALLSVAVVAGAFFSIARLANADRELLLNASRVRAASRDIVAAREISQNGIVILVKLRDGTERRITLPRRTLASDPEESFELFRVPSPDAITAADLSGQPPIPDGFPVVNATAILRVLNAALADVLHEPTSASYVVARGNVLVADDAPGQVVDTDSLTKQIDASIRALAPLPTFMIEAHDAHAFVRSDELRVHLGAAMQLASLPGPSISYQKYSWRLPGKVIVPMLSVATSTGDFSVDTARLYDSIRLLARSLVTTPVAEPVFTAGPQRLTISKEGQAGHDIDIAPIVRAINDWVNAVRRATESGAGERVVVAPHIGLDFVDTTPRLSAVELANEGIDELVGVASTSFKGSTKDRIWNITLGASRVTDFIIQPNEEFSLVSALGYMEKENGYREEYVIKDGRSRKEAGGGLCQLATTFFRAALSAGLPVTERHNHLYVVGYYGPGLDAGIYDIGHDLRFVNDFSSPLLVQATIVGTSLKVEFFAKPDGRIATTSDPYITDKLPPPPPDYRFADSVDFGTTECTDHPREGMTTYATTTVRYISGAVKRTVWKSVYEPWPKICLIGTKGLSVFQVDN